MANYTIWVGGIEYNDFYLTKSEAQAIANDLINDGYDDVQIQKVEV